MGHDEEKIDSATVSGDHAEDVSNEQQVAELTGQLALLTKEMEGFKQREEATQQREMAQTREIVTLQFKLETSCETVTKLIAMVRDLRKVKKMTSSSDGTTSSPQTPKQTIYRDTIKKRRQWPIIRGSSRTFRQPYRRQEGYPFVGRKRRTESASPGPSSIEITDREDDMVAFEVPRRMIPHFRVYPRYFGTYRSKLVSRAQI